MFHRHQVLVSSGSGGVHCTVVAGYRSEYTALMLLSGVQQEWTGTQGLLYTLELKVTWALFWSLVAWRGRIFDGSKVRHCIGTSHCTLRPLYRQDASFGTLLQGQGSVRVAGQEMGGRHIHVVATCTPWNRQALRCHACSSSCACLWSDSRRGGTVAQN